MSAHKRFVDFASTTSLSHMSFYLALVSGAGSTFWETGVGSSFRETTLEFGAGSTFQDTGGSPPPRRSTFRRLPTAGTAR